MERKRFLRARNLLASRARRLNHIDSGRDRESLQDMTLALCISSKGRSGDGVTSLFDYSHIPYAHRITSLGLGPLVLSNTNFRLLVTLILFVELYTSRG